MSKKAQCNAIFASHDSSHEESPAPRKETFWEGLGDVSIVMSNFFRYVEMFSRVLDSKLRQAGPTTVSVLERGPSRVLPAAAYFLPIHATVTFAIPDSHARQILLRSTRLYVDERNPLLLARNGWRAACPAPKGTIERGRTLVA